MLWVPKASESVRDRILDAETPGEQTTHTLHMRQFKGTQRGTGMERMARLRLFTLFSVVVQEPQPSTGTGRLCPARAESDRAHRRDTGLVNL